MKKILFVSNPMNCGGMEKALLALFDVIDFNEYEVSFMPYRDGGCWNHLIPEQVKFIDPPEYLERMMLYNDQVKKQIVKNLLHPVILFQYIYAVFRGIITGKMGISRQKYWTHTQKSLKPIDGEFDAAFAFQGEIGSYFIIDKVNAKRKVAWFHGDYNNYVRDKEIDREYWNKLDFYASDTEIGRKTIVEAFPELEEKTIWFNNIISGKQIIRDSEEQVTEKYVNGAINISSIGRLNVVKGFDLAIEAAKIIVGRGYQLNWWIVGDGEEMVNLQKKIEEYHLNGSVVLLGFKDNPYPYVRMSDIFVHTSRAEGKPLVIDSTKVLLKPIVSTAFSTVYDQIENGVNGSIVSFEPEEIADGIIKLYHDKEMQEIYIQNLKQENISNEQDVQILYDMIG